MGFTMAPVLYGSLERDAGFGDDREDPARVFCSAEEDRDNLPKAEGFAGRLFARFRVSMRQSSVGSIRISACEA